MEFKREAGLAWIVLALAVGNLVIYALGTLGLAWVTHFPLLKAFAVGVVPFLPGDLLKFIASAWIALKLRKVLKGRGLMLK
jgi:biotin transport system substrate-specific component